MLYNGNNSPHLVLCTATPPNECIAPRVEGSKRTLAVFAPWRATSNIRIDVNVAILSH